MNGSAEMISTGDTLNMSLGIWLKAMELELVLKNVVDTNSHII